MKYKNNIKKKTKIRTGRKKLVMYKRIFKKDSAYFSTELSQARMEKYNIFKVLKEKNFLLISFLPGKIFIHN